MLSTPPIILFFCLALLITNFMLVDSAETTSIESEARRRIKKGWDKKELEELEKEYLEQLRQEHHEDDQDWLFHPREHHPEGPYLDDAAPSAAAAAQRKESSQAPPGSDGGFKDAQPLKPKLSPLVPPPDLTQNLHLRYDPAMKAHILLAAPCYGGMVTEGFALSLVETFTRMSAVKGLSVSIKLLPGDSLVTRARNTLVALFLGSKEYTHLLFIDTDITFSPDNVFRLLGMTKHKPIVAAPYPKKGLQFQALRHHIKSVLKQDPNHDFTEEELSDAMVDYVFNPFSENDGSPYGRSLVMEEGFIRVDNAGTGFMMIRRDVLTTMAEYYSDLKYNNDILAYSSPATDDNFYGLFDTMVDPNSRRLLSEDYAFCRRAQALGFEIWMDLYADLQHQGTHNFDGNFAKSFVVQAG